MPFEKLNLLKGMAVLCAIALSPTALAQDNACDVVTSDNYVSVSADARVDYQHLWHDGETINSESGFEGKYFMFRVDGTIVPGLTYSWRQRLNKNISDGAFFDATDWIYIDYRTGRFNFNAGKEIVQIGGWEYDRHPIDLYSTSVFWQNVACYQMGAWAGVELAPGQSLTAQVTQSLFHTKENRNMFAYNLLWNGKMGLYHALWSVNLVEYAPGKYINYIALGNRFDVNRVTIEADVMNRAAAHQAFLGRDLSIMAEVAWQPVNRWRLHAKYTYDVNRSHTDADAIVLNGTELNMAGGGVEFYPLLKDRTSLRLHANCYHSWGKNANKGDIMQNGSTMLSVGVRWHMDLFSVKRK